MQININNQMVESHIVSDADTSSADFNAREILALTAIDAALRRDPRFEHSAQLLRVDSMRAVSETNPGRYYLRYKTDAGMVEFWGHVSKRAKLDWQRGTIGVVLSNTAPINAPTNPEPVNIDNQPQQE